MRNKPKPSLLDLLRDVPAERGTPTTKKPKEQPAPPPNVVDRRDERGTPYKGDFPHPLGDRNDGCF